MSLTQSQISTNVSQTCIVARPSPLTHVGFKAWSETHLVPRGINPGCGCRYKSFSDAFESQVLMIFGEFLYTSNAGDRLSPPSQQ